MKKNNTSGLLITFCGLDGCGKTTMINRLESELSDKYRIFTTKEPTETVRRSDVFRTFTDTPDRTVFDYRGLSLFAASDRLQHNRIIRDQLYGGKIVICDRYFYSCLANLRARGYKDDKWIYEISKSVIKPDIAFFLDIPTEDAIRRVRKRPSEKDRYIDTELQKALREEYVNICKKNGGILIPTDIPETETYRMIKNEVERLIIKNGYKN